jgi:hypothetical protein
VIPGRLPNRRWNPGDVGYDLGGDTPIVPNRRGEIAFDLIEDAAGDGLATQTFRAACPQFGRLGNDRDHQTRQEDSNASGDQ